MFFTGKIIINTYFLSLSGSVETKDDRQTKIF